MKTKRTWSTPSLSIYGKVEAVTAKGGGPRWRVEVLLQVNVLGVMMYGPCGDMVSRIVV
jgi:hypothetical protein